MKIKVTGVYVDDQDKALRFYTEVLASPVLTDFQPGPISLADGMLTWRTSDGTSRNRLSTTTRPPKPIRRPYSSKASPPPCFSATTCRPITSV